MKKILAVALLAAATTVSAAPANAQMMALKSLDATTAENAIVHKIGHRGRRRGRFAAGLALGIVGAAVAAHAYSYNRRDYVDRWERRCRRWRRACDDGYDRACWKYDDRC